MGLKVVVTGASSGIGRASALRFSKDGHEVFATARSESKLAETVALAKGIKVQKGVGDVGVEADVKKNYAEAIKALGGELDVVVLNAGYSFDAPVEEMTPEEWDAIFATNVRGVFLWIKEVIPAFKTRGSGQIIIINSVIGEAALAPNSTAYTATKFALSGLAAALRVELQGTGVKIASVLPGVTDTNIFETEIWESKGKPGHAREMFGVANASLSPEDIAEAIAVIAYQSSRSDIDKIKVWQAYPKAK